MSLEYLVQKCDTSSNLVAQLSVLLKFIINNRHNWWPTAAIPVSELFHVTNVGVDSYGDIRQPAEM